MEPGAQEPVGWNILTPNELEVLKKAMPPDEPEVIDELNKAMRSVRNDGNAVSLDEKISITLNVVKAVLFLLRATEGKEEEAAIVDISPQELRYMLRNLTKFAGSLIRSLSLNDVFLLMKASVAAVFQSITNPAGQASNPNPSDPRNT